MIVNLTQNYLRPYFTDIELAAHLDGTADSRYSKVKRLLAQDKLLHIRRGLYCWTDKMGNFAKPHPFELAQQIYAPSAISLESAMAYHNLIPEAVYAITSVCTKRTKEFRTPLGVFNYAHLPQENFYVEVDLIADGHYRYFVAKPWKAICDYVYCYKKNWDGLTPLRDSLRINVEDLPALSDETIELLEEYYHHNRLKRFLRGLTRDLRS